eukprot:359839-Chlamydomonas_euryale.AAC.6
MQKQSSTKTPRPAQLSANLHCCFLQSAEQNLAPAVVKGRTGGRCGSKSKGDFSMVANDPRSNAPDPHDAGHRLCDATCQSAAGSETAPGGTSVAQFVTVAMPNMCPGLTLFLHATKKFMQYFSISSRFKAFDTVFAMQTKPMSAAETGHARI